MILPILVNHFGKKTRLVTHILFDLFLFKDFSPVANFGYLSLISPKMSKCLIDPILPIVKMFDRSYNQFQNYKSKLSRILDHMQSEQG